MDRERVIHPIDPTYSEDSKILILGSFPSVKSRETGYFYGHPQNRFWKVLAALYDEDVPAGNEEKKAFLLKHNIAVWDVIRECTLKGSSDSSIQDAIPNDLSEIVQHSRISRIFCNGTTAYRLFQKYQKDICDIEVTLLPSTSAANASYSLERLQEKWKIIL